MSVSVNLGPRLQRVAAFVPEGSRLGDIGTDHAYLPIFLWEKGKIEKAVAVDVHEGPYRSAYAAIQSRGLQGVIDVRYGDGLKPIGVGEVNTLTLAGMGGNTMLEIFAARRSVMSDVRDLVLQPQGAEGKVRLTLLQAGWRLTQEEYVAEEGRIYVVMHYSRQGGHALGELQDKVHRWLDKVLIALGDQIDFKKSLTQESLIPNEEGQRYSADGLGENHEEAYIENIVMKLIWELGPLAMDYPSQELKILIRERVQALQRTIAEMQKSNQKKVQKRIQEYLLTIKILEELEKCLFPLV